MSLVRPVARYVSAKGRLGCRLHGGHCPEPGAHSSASCLQIFVSRVGGVGASASQLWCTDFSLHGKGGSVGRGEVSEGRGRGEG